MRPLSFYDKINMLRNQNIAIDSTSAFYSENYTERENIYIYS